MSSRARAELQRHFLIWGQTQPEVEMGKGMEEMTGAGLRESFNSSYIPRMHVSMLRSLVGVAMRCFVFGDGAVERVLSWH